MVVDVTVDVAVALSAAALIVAAALPGDLAIACPQRLRARFRTCIGHSVVPAVATTTHADFQAVLPAKATPVVAAVLHALAGVDDDLRGGAMTPDCHQQCILRQFARQTGFHRPANDAGE